MTETSAQSVTTDTVAKPRFDLQQHVTDTIIKQLEAGTVPWLKPWKDDHADFRIPKNAVTGNSYRGVNILLLWGASHVWQYPSNEWASLKQWNSKKESIRPKESGQMIVFAKKDQKEVDGEMKEVTYLRYSYVFNRCQLASYKPEEQPPVEQPPLVEKIAVAEDFVANTFADIQHRKGGACYSPKSDKIFMPPMDSFIETKECSASENYYSTLFHELTHWTGHAKRLDRQIKKQIRRPRLCRRRTDRRTRCRLPHCGIRHHLTGEERPRQLYCALAESAERQ